MKIRILVCQFGSKTGAEGELSRTFLREILDPSSPRCKLLEMNKAITADIKLLLERTTFKEISVEDNSAVGNVLPSRFVLAIELTQDNKVKV